MSLHRHTAPVDTKPWIFLPILALIAALLLPVSASAQQSPQLEPGRLAFHIQTGDSLTLYTTLTTPVALANLVVENNGLVNDEKTANIPPDKVFITPAGGDIPAGQQRFAVTIQQPEKPGHYTGELVLRYEIADTVKTLPLRLEVAAMPKPQIAASAASANQVLILRPGFFYLGQSNSASTDQPAGNQIVITLQQSGGGDAALTGVKIDPLRATTQSLPGEVLVVSPAISASQPLRTSAGTADLTVRAGSTFIPPGEYQSSLRVSVAGQQEPVEVPFKVQSRAGLFWPLLIAVIGMLFGYLSYTLNQKVNPLAKPVEKVKQVQAMLAEPDALQAEDVEKFAGMLEAIQKRMIAGEEATTLEASLDELIAQIKAQQEENRKFLLPEGDLGKAIQEMEALEVGVRVRDEIVAGLRSIGDRVERGAYRSMADARRELIATQPQRTDLLNAEKDFLEVKRLADADQAAGTPPQVDIADLKVRLNQATDLNTLKRDANDALVIYDPSQASFAAPAGEDAMQSFRELLRGAKDVHADWEAFTTGLKVQRLLGVAATAIFALIGGVIALYAPNATWGASVNDYITLLVWALSVNIIAGQTVDFKATLQAPAQPAV